MIFCEFVKELCSCLRGQGQDIVKEREKLYGLEYRIEGTDLYIFLTSCPRHESVLKSSELGRKLVIYHGMNGWHEN